MWGEITDATETVGRHPRASPTPRDRGTACCTAADESPRSCTLEGGENQRPSTPRSRSGQRSSAPSQCSAPKGSRNWSARASCTCAAPAIPATASEVRALRRRDPTLPAMRPWAAVVRRGGRYGSVRSRRRSPTAVACALRDGTCLVRRPLAAGTTDGELVSAQDRTHDRPPAKEARLESRRVPIAPTCSRSRCAEAARRRKLVAQCQSDRNRHPGKSMRHLTGNPGGHG